MFSYEICEIFKNTFFCKTAVLWWLLLAVNCVHTEDIHWKFMLPKKKWYNWTVLLRLVFLDKEYSSKVFQTLLAVPHFSKVAVAEVLCKKGVPENFANHSCFPVNFAKFSRTPFLQNTSGRLLLYIDNTSENQKLLGRNSLNDFNFYVPCHSSETQITTTKI